MFLGGSCLREVCSVVEATLITNGFKDQKFIKISFYRNSEFIFLIILNLNIHFLQLVEMKFLSHPILFDQMDFQCTLAHCIMPLK